MKCSGRQASARANHPRSTSRASAMTRPASAAQRRKPPSNMKFVGSAARRPGRHPEHSQGRPPPAGRRLQRAAGPFVGLRARGREKRHRRSRHQVEQPRIGAVVDPRRVRARVEQDRHEDRGEHSERDVTATPSPAPAPRARSAGATGAPAARPGRTAPRSPATTCAAAATASRTARSTTGARR